MRAVGPAGAAGPVCTAPGRAPCGGSRAGGDWLRTRVSGEDANVDLQKDIRRPLRKEIPISQLTEGNMLLTHTRVSCVLSAKWI